MSSYEDRIRSVWLYIKSGKRTGATIRQLGYPPKNALKSWHQKFEQDHDLPMGYMRSKRTYSDEEKNCRRSLRIASRSIIRAWMTPQKGDKSASVRQQSIEMDVEFSDREIHAFN